MLETLPEAPVESFNLYMIITYVIGVLAAVGGCAVSVGMFLAFYVYVQEDLERRPEE